MSFLSGGVIHILNSLPSLTDSINKIDSCIFINNQAYTGASI
jgi:hypothetical protein